ncbi:MAG: hypothetical protein L6R41_004021 [Letrouitia leprolyta]|nr:MAG: hypothetical protein L6R41_004021 [Letrouitia leprolyta]
MEAFPRIAAVEYATGPPENPIDNEDMPRPRPRRTSSTVGDDLRGDTGASALSTLEPTPTFASPPSSPVEHTLSRHFYLANTAQNLRPQEPLDPQDPQELEEPQIPQEPPRRHRRRRRAIGWFRRWQSFTFRHTWVNPLVIILTVLVLYGIWPKPTNPLYSALFLSYRLSPSDPLIPSDVRSNYKAPIHYGKGKKDFAFVAFYIVVLSFTREFIMQLILRPLARWFQLRSRSKQNRFMEQTYTATYFGIFGPYGLYVMYRSPVWYFNTAGMYETFPNRTHEGLFKAYYLLQASYWAQQAIVLCLLLEKPRRDFKELVGHHIVTLALIGDFFLATSKTFSYLDLRIVTPYFATFILVWIYLRHYINILILHSITTTFATIGPFDLNWETQQYKCSLSQYITFSLLASLQAINIFWLYFIGKVAIKVWRGGAKKDERSDDEDEDEKEEIEKKARERERAEMEREIEEKRREKGKGKEVESNGAVVNGGLKENQPPSSSSSAVAATGDVRKRA